MGEQINIEELLLNGTPAQIEAMIRFIHPADVLDVLHEHEDLAREILQKLPDEMIGAIIDEEEAEDKYELLRGFTRTHQKTILDEMSSDEITDMIGSMDDEEGKDVFNILDKEDQEDVKQLLSYDPDSAGGIMTTEFIGIYDNKTVLKTLEYLKSECQDVEMATYIYVISRNMELKGVVSLRDLVFTAFDTRISTITNHNVISIDVDMDQEEVANTFDKYGFVMMPVVDKENKILGVITIDDILEVIKEEASEDIHHMAGLAKEERVDGTIGDSIKSRLPWLIINLLTALMASMVIDLFQSTISQVVALSAVMTIVSGMGGNAGTQSLTIIVRGLSLGELTKENARKVLMKELVVGLVNGLVIAIFVSILALYYEFNMMFGLIAGIAMVLNMIMANFSGYLVPVVLEKMKIDPALASGVFVTTVTDVLGFLFFLGLASMFMQYLV